MDPPRPEVKDAIRAARALGKQLPVEIEVENLPGLEQALRQCEAVDFDLATLLLQVELSSPRRVEVNRLLSFLRWFEACGPDLIPDNSILREFIGGSILRDYAP